MKIVIFLSVFLLEIFSIYAKADEIPYNGVKYHYVDSSTENRTTEVGWQYCEYTYDDANRYKRVLIIFPNDTVPKKIGFYCKEDGEDCDDLRCRVNDNTVFYVLGIFLVIIIIVLICGPRIDRIKKERARLNSNCRDDVSINTVRTDSTLA